MGANLVCTTAQACIPAPPMCERSNGVIELLGGLKEMVEKGTWKGIDTSWSFYVPREKGTHWIGAVSGFSYFSHV